jgi:hypothetical protein
MEQAYPDEKSPNDRTLRDEEDPAQDQSREAFMFLPRLNEASGAQREALN